MLRSCCAADVVEMAERLLDCGALITATDNSGCTPFLVTAAALKVDALRMLISRRGIDVRATDIHGNNALHLACAHCTIRSEDAAKVIEILLAAGVRGECSAVLCPSQFHSCA